MRERAKVRQQSPIPDPGVLLPKLVLTLLHTLVLGNLKGKDVLCVTFLHVATSATTTQPCLEQQPKEEYKRVGEM